jgi:hypothetical protein
MLNKSGLYIFASIDIANSTSYKYRNDNWFPILRRFYNVLPKDIFKVWRKLAERSQVDDPNVDVGKDPELWKTIGDEVVLKKELTYPYQAVLFIESIIEATNKYDLSISQASRGRLNLKVSAWTAGFPKNNHIISMTAPSSDNINQDYNSAHKDNNSEIDEVYQSDADHARHGASSNIDYVGISMDAGFRLSKYSTQRKFSISVELAYLVADILTENKSDGKIDIHYGGSISLKGVFDGIEYPWFWIDRNKGDTSYGIVDKLEGRSTPRSNEIKAVSEIFIKKVSEFTCVPYIALCDYGKIPSDHQSFIDGLNELDQTENAIRENSETDGPPSEVGSMDGRITTFIEAGVQKTQTIKESKK